MTRAGEQGGAFAMGRAISEFEIVGQYVSVKTRMARSNGIFREFITTLHDHRFYTLHCNTTDHCFHTICSVAIH